MNEWEFKRKVGASEIYIWYCSDYAQADVIGAFDEVEHIEGECYYFPSIGVGGTPNDAEVNLLGQLGCM